MGMFRKGTKGRDASCNVLNKCQAVCAFPRLLQCSSGECYVCARSDPGATKDSLSPLELTVFTEACRHVRKKGKRTTIR